MGKITSIPPLSKDIVGMNGISLIRYSKFCKNKSSMRVWKKEWSTLICLEILFWLNFAFHSCNEGYIRALGSYIAPFTCMILTMCLCFADGEDGYQRLGNEIPQRLLDMAPRKSKQRSQIRVC